MHTEDSLREDFLRLGVPRGGVLLLHSSMRSLGTVQGGPETVLRALFAVLGPDGTLLSPTFTTNLTDPCMWPVPPPEEERQRLMASMPCFDPCTSPPHKMGVIAATLWRLPGARRSDHPVTSWAGFGPLAGDLLRDHPLDDPEGPDGPVGRACKAGAQILLLGVDHDANTTIHLAECLLDMPHLRVLPDRYPARQADGTIVWRPIARTTKCSDGFVKIGPALDAARVARRGRVGDAPAVLLSARDVVRVAATLLARDPARLLCDDPTCVHCPTSKETLREWRPDPGWQERLLALGITATQAA